jgi:hypothetical protein
MARIKSVDNYFMGSGRLFDNFMLLSNWEGEGSEYYRFTAEGDNPCKKCLEFDGQVLRISEARALQAVPPLHPNCKCVIEVLSEEPQIITKTREAPINLAPSATTIPHVTSVPPTTIPPPNRESAPPPVTTRPPTQDTPPATTIPTTQAPPTTVPRSNDSLARRAESSFVDKGNQLYEVNTKILIDGVEISFEYDIKNGIIVFCYDKNDYGKLILMKGQMYLARAIIDVARNINPNYLNGRTVNGIIFELDAHYIGYSRLGRITNNNMGANPADIGSLNRFDYSCGNADDFERGGLGSLYRSVVSFLAGQKALGLLAD